MGSCAKVLPFTAVADCVVAVSYTHLDVYKRQAPDQALTLGEERVYNPEATDCVIFSFGNGMPMSLRAARQIEACLLYTSRCV